MIKVGGVAWYINHSCSSNCHMVQWSLSVMPGLGIYAVVPIQMFEEITIDCSESYGSGLK